MDRVKVVMKQTTILNLLEAMSLDRTGSTPMSGPAECPRAVTERVHAAAPAKVTRGSSRWTIPSSISNNRARRRGVRRMDRIKGETWAMRLVSFVGSRWSRMVIKGARRFQKLILRFCVAGTGTRKEEEIQKNVAMRSLDRPRRGRTTLNTKIGGGRIRTQSQRDCIEP